MPRGDGTGPGGFGPMTGRGMGYCAGYDVPGFANPGPVGFGYGRGRGFAGRGYGRGLGLGRGYGRGAGWYRGAYPVPPYPAAYGYDYAAPYSKEEETASLRSQADFLKERLDAVEKRISEIDQSDSES